MARGSTSGPGDRPAVSRAERVLATMTATVMGLSVLAFLAVLIAGLFGVRADSGVWVMIVVLPLVGLPIGFLLMVALIVVNGVNRSRRARHTG